MDLLPPALTLALLATACGGYDATTPTSDVVADGADAVDAVDAVHAVDAVDAVDALDTSGPARIVLAPGALDPDYGDAGVVRVPTAWSPLGILALPDGGVLIYGFPPPTVSGDLFHGTALRLTVHGDIDTSFGVDGAASLPSGATPLVALRLPDGSITLGGYYFELSVRPGIWRLRSDGSFDPDFGAAGVVRPSVGTAVCALAVAEGGALRAFGYNGYAPETVVLHLRADGTPDPAFGQAGAVKADLGLSVDYTNTCAPGDDGGFVLLLIRAGKATLVHVRADGTQDPSFGHLGFLELESGETVRDAAGRFIVAARNAAARAPRELAFTALAGTAGGPLPQRSGGGAIFAWGSRADGQSGIVAAAIRADGSNDVDYGTDGTFDLWRDLHLEASQGVGVATLDATGNVTFAAHSDSGDLIVVRLGP
ncbi:MAG: hypothetical protein U1F43_21170 [Myxococcota bacterium]